jgi:hypothetical protein
MFRSYILAMLLLFASGVIFTVLASSTICLAAGLLQLSVGAGGLSAGFMSDIDARSPRHNGRERQSRERVRDRAAGS